MVLRILAAAALLLLLWWAFRLAMGLRWSKIERERARRREEETGRKVVAELPLPEGVLFFVEDERALHWGEHSVARADVAGARLLLNSAVVSAAAREGAALPAPPAPEEEPGREKWEVAVYLRDGRALTVRCGSVREGISRQAARAVFDALRREVQA
jgi:hypothetical protein